MAQQAAPRNWFVVWVSVAVVAVLAIVVGLVVWMNSSATTAGPRPEGSGVNAETGGIAVGTGSDQVDLWFDFYCPHCQDFEDAEGETIGDLLESGDITLNLFPVALSGLNAASGTDFSIRSANAMYCIADDEPDAVYPFFTALFATHPSGAGQTDEELIAMAGEAGATGVESCITERTYADFVESQTAALPTNPSTGGAGTPTLVINDEFIAVTLDPEADILAHIGG